MDLFDTVSVSFATFATFATPGEELIITVYDSKDIYYIFKRENGFECHQESFQDCCTLVPFSVQLASNIRPTVIEKSIVKKVENAITDYNLLFGTEISTTTIYSCDDL